MAFSMDNDTTTGYVRGINFNKGVAYNRPYSFSCQFYPIGVSGSGRIITSLFTTASGSHRLSFAVNASDKLIFTERHTGITTTTSTASVNFNAWNSAQFTISSGQPPARRLYLNGNTPVTNDASTYLVNSPNNWILGASWVSYAISPTYNGYIQDFAVWNAVLTDDECYALSKGISPRLVRTSDLTIHVPGIRNITEAMGAPDISNDATGITYIGTSIVNNQRRYG